MNFDCSQQQKIFHEIPHGARKRFRDGAYASTTSLDSNTLSFQKHAQFSIDSTYMFNST